MGAGAVAKEPVQRGLVFCFLKCMYVNLCIEKAFKRITKKLRVIISGWQEYW